MAAEQKLKIAMVLRLFSPSGGLELYALKLIEGLLQDGHKVSVICERDESNLSHENLRVHLFPPAGRKAGKGERLDYYFEQTSKLLAQLTAGEGPFDIVHSQHFPVSPVDVVTFHNHTAMRLCQVGYPWERILNQAKMTATRAYRTRHRYDRQLASEARMRIFVGEVMHDDFYNNFAIPANAPYAVVHPGAELKATAVDPQPDKRENRPFQFLFVGKGFRKKGLDTLLKACAILKKRGQNFTLSIAGMKDKSTARLNLKLLGLADRVQFLGFRKDMPTVFARSQAIILPSKIEPFGMAPIEGMQYGLVPIVSKVCGVAEVLNEGQDALILHNHLDATELADLMQSLIVDSELYNRLASRAKETADKLHWRNTVDGTEKAYGRILAEKQKT
ncbi:MAG: glycosyltransferase family 4 protein [Cyanobacteria bacterium SZAS LIN-2]|nr:glycosyltransferase family 4 protein [Cyanobacteria bacterium SZAS LIN-2]